MIAAMHGRAKVVRMLIDANVNVDAANAFGCEASVRYLCIFADMFDDFRSTAVYWAAAEGHYKIVHMLAKVRERKKKKRCFSFRCLNSCKSNYRFVLTYTHLIKLGSCFDVVLILLIVILIAYFVIAATHQ